MDYKQKYEEALERARDLHDNHPLGQPQTWTTCEKIFPELRESEDERIRKEIIQFIQDNMCVIHKDKCLAWLEKQGDKKGTVTPQWIIDFLEDHRRYFGTPMDYDEQKEVDGKLLAVINWLKSLKDRVQLQPQQEWSERDNFILKNVYDFVKENTIDPNRVNCAEECLNWLKSLKPNHWKPSEEQLRALINSAQGLYQCKEKEVLLDLYEQLKNL